MSEFQDLQATLSKTPILLIDADNGDVRLIGRAAMTDRIMGAGDAAAVGTMMDLAAAAKNLARIAGQDDRDFTIADIQTIAAMPRPSIENWMLRGLLAASIREGDGTGGRGKERLFSCGDAFCAAVLARLICLRH